jgi:hypothetical protein
MRRVHGRPRWRCLCRSHFGCRVTAESHWIDVNLAPPISRPGDRTMFVTESSRRHTTCRGARRDEQAAVGGIRQQSP